MRHAQDATTHGNLEIITTFLRIAQIASRPIGTNQEPRNQVKKGFRPGSHAQARSAHPHGWPGEDRPLEYNAPPALESITPHLEQTRAGTGTRSPY